MNTLIIAAQDIREITLGLLRGNQNLVERTIEGAPEEHLPLIDIFLKEQGLTIQDIDQLYVVTGPGSFTASRVSVTIANTIAFVKQIPIYGLDNKEKAPLTELIPLFLKQTKQEFIVPSYDRPPHIT